MLATDPKNRTRSRIPRHSVLEQGLPIEDLYQFARREGNSKKPIYEIHKWWARRLGHVFRFLLIGATTRAMKKKNRRQQKALLRKFYRRNDLGQILVLDPFMGGGTSVVEALKCGARVIGVDIDPVAWFVTKKEVEPFDEESLLKHFSKIEEDLSRDLRAYYQTNDPETGNLAAVVNAFWVSRFKCPECRRILDAHPHFRLTFNPRTELQTVFCSKCSEVREVPIHQKWFKCGRCMHTTVVMKGTVVRGTLKCGCGTETPILKLIKPGVPANKHLFAVEYSLVPQGAKVPGRKFKRADRSDLKRFNEAREIFERRKTSLRFPTAEILGTNRFDRRPITHGYTTYDQLFNPRQLLCLSTILESIRKIEDVNCREYLLLAFSDCLASNNVLVSYAFGYQKVTPLFAIHGYQVPQRPVEGNVWGNPDFGRGSFTRCVTKLIAGKRYALNPFEYKYDKDGRAQQVPTREHIETQTVKSPDMQSGDARACLLNQSSVNLSSIHSDTVDLILTDPPFYNNLPYSELSDFYYQWLRLDLQSTHENSAVPEYTPMQETLLVKRRTENEHTRYLGGLVASMRECARVLKPDGLMAFTFHHREPLAWSALAAALAQAGFRVTSISPVRAEGVSGFHSYAGTPKWDSVICCRHSEHGVTLPTALTEAKQKQIERQIIARTSAWRKRMRSGKMPWNPADDASLGYALALQVIVNYRLSDSSAGRLLSFVARTFPQKGVSATPPKWLAQASAATH